MIRPPKTGTCDESPPENGAGFVFFCKFVYLNKRPDEKVDHVLPPLVFVICMVLLCACHESDNEQILDQLDQVIESKGLYAVRFERRVDSLRRELCTASDDTMRWRTANRLFDSYITYNIDTAARYVALMYDLAEHTGRRDMKFLSTTCDISVLIGRNNIEDAYDRIRSLDTAGITKRMRANYYTQQMVVYGRLASQNTSESRSRAYADTLARIRRVRIGFDGHSYVTRQRLRAIDLLSQQRCDEALDVLLPLYNPRQSSRTLARVAYNIANVYETLGDREQRKYWLARAAVNDLRTPVREYLSLYELALMMFEEKDMERAARYIQCTVADMLSCNYNTRIFHSSQAEMIINQAVVYSINSRSRILTVMVSVFLLLLVIIALLLFHTQRQHRRLRRNTSLIYEVNRRLHERNEQFRIVNDHLRDANKIKDSYVFRYMQLATHYIGRVDEYRMELRKTAKTDGTEAPDAQTAVAFGCGPQLPRLLPHLRRNVPRHLPRLRRAGQRVARRAGAFSGAFGRGSFDRTAHPGRHAAGDHRQRLHRQFSELRFGNGLYLSHQTPQFGARLAQRFRKPGSAHRPLTGFLTDRPFAAGILS